jgi:hypothetical protein
VQVAQSRFTASSELDCEIVGAVGNHILRKLLSDDLVPGRLPTLSARTLEVASLLLWTSVTELVMAAEVWAHCSNGRLLCKSRLKEVFLMKASEVSSPNLSNLNVRMQPSTMHQMCSAVKTVFWVRVEI